MTKEYEILKKICDRRRSVRRFSDQGISDETVKCILDIAYTSPYASGKKNWELVAVKDKERIQKIAHLVGDEVTQVTNGVKKDFRHNFESYAKNFSCFDEAPVLIIPTFRIAPGLSVMLKKSDPHILQWERDNYVKSISCVAMLVLLAAESLGLCACYMTGPLIAEEKIGKIIKSKNGRNIGAIIPIGYPKERENEY